MSKKEEKLRYDAISEMGCVICRMPCEIHHLKGHEFGSGMGLKGGWENSIGLCTNHHRGLQGFHSMGKASWQEMFGTQKELLEMVNKHLTYSTVTL